MLQHDVERICVLFFLYFKLWKNSLIINTMVYNAKHVRRDNEKRIFSLVQWCYAQSIPRFTLFRQRWGFFFLNPWKIGVLGKGFVTDLRLYLTPKEQIEIKTVTLE